jgi:hypothetical protein
VFASQQALISRQVSEPQQSKTYVPAVRLASCFVLVGHMEVIHFDRLSDLCHADGPQTAFAKIRGRAVRIAAISFDIGS